MNIENNKKSEEVVSSLSPLKQNIIRIIFALIIGLLIAGTVFATDYFIDLIKNLF